MSAGLAATMYAWLAHGIAFLLIPWSIPLSQRIRSIAFWAIAAPLLFFLERPLVVLFLASAIMLILAGGRRVERAAFFLVAVPALPVHLMEPLPFPGLTYLTLASHYKFAAIALLLPLLFPVAARTPRTSPRRFSVPDGCLLLYVFYTAAVVATAINPTTGLRVLIDQATVLALPYFALRLAVERVEDIDVLLQAFLISAIVLASVALVSALKQWDFYYFISGVYGRLTLDTRSGFLRINATAGTHSLAYLLAAGLIVLEYLKHRIRIGLSALTALRIVLFAGMLTTDSRGALGALAVAVFAHILLSTSNRMLRATMLCLGGVGAIAAGIWLVQGDFTSYTNDNFTYRQELLRTSIEYIMRYPIFGDYLFLDSGFFNHLMQGQRIVDVTNFYLQLALHYGLLGFTLFLVAICATPFRMARLILRQGASRPDEAAYRKHRRAASENSSRNVGAHAPPDDDLLWRRAAIATVSVTVGWLFLVATTSDVALTMHLGIAFAGLNRALLDLRTRAQPLPSARPDTVPSLARVPR